MAKRFSYQKYFEGLGNTKSKASYLTGTMGTKKNTGGERPPSQTGDPRRPQTPNGEMDKDVQSFITKKRAEMKSQALKKKTDPFSQKALGHHIYRRERHSISQLKRLSKINRKEQLREGRPIGVDIY